MIRVSYIMLLLWLNPAYGTTPEPLRVGLHLSAPWSFYNAQGQPDGIEYQLLSRIFQRAGLDVNYEFHSYSRLLKQFSDGKLDCASPVAIAIEGASYTQPYLPFQDVAVSLAENELQIDKLSQLAGLRIVAYQQAQQVLGAEFSRVVGQANYIEMAERRLQLELLFNQRVDLVIGERRVLQYLAVDVAPHQTLKLHSLFAQKQYPAACWQPRLTAILDQGIKQMAASGELEQVLALFSLPDTSELR